MSTLPVYDTDTSKLPEIDESALNTAGVGLYRVKGKAKNGDYYDATIDHIERNVDQVLLARVDEGAKFLPAAVERAEIRPDGKRLIVAWVRA